MITPESWPTDPRECYDLLNRYAQQVEDLQAALDQSAKLHDQAVQEHEQLIQELHRQLELYRRFIFGPRRERLVEAPGQGHRFELDAGKTARRSMATQTQWLAPVSQRPLLRQTPQVGAVCEGFARTDLRGGTSARAFHPATLAAKAKKAGGPRCVTGRTAPVSGS
jgi:hypothetical protein